MKYNPGTGARLRNIMSSHSSDTFGLESRITNYLTKASNGFKLPIEYINLRFARPHNLTITLFYRDKFLATIPVHELPEMFNFSPIILSPLKAGGYISGFLKNLSRQYSLNENTVQVRLFQHDGKVSIELFEGPDYQCKVDFQQLIKQFA
jgi:hypothetical protein